MNEFLTFAEARTILAERLGATPEEIAHEIAVWVFLRNIAAYQNVLVAGDRDRFHFSDSGRETGDFDYLPKLGQCYFKRRNIEEFEPPERYITGPALMHRWAVYCDGEAGAKQAIRAWCRRFEGPLRLADYFPGYGGTQASAEESDFDRWPTLEINSPSLTTNSNTLWPKRRAA